MPREAGVYDFTTIRDNLKRIQQEKEMSVIKELTTGDVPSKINPVTASGSIPLSGDPTPNKDIYDSYCGYLSSLYAPLHRVFPGI